MAKYWVGGTGNTNDPTNHWATTSGGAPGAGNAPTAADDIFIDANSGTGTITINAALACRSFQTAGSSIATIVHNSATTVTAGDATAPSGGKALDLSGITTYTLGQTTSSQWAFVSTNASTHDINCNGKTMGDFTFNTSANPTYRLTGGMVQGSTARITQSQGNFNFNGQTVTLGLFLASATSVRTITGGAATINILGTGGNAWNITTSANLTLSMTSATINLTGASPSFASGNKNYGTVIFAGTTGNKSIVSTGSTFATLTITGPASTTDNYTFSGDITVTGTFTVAGSSEVNRPILLSSVFGTPRTITAGATVLSNTDFRDITGAGAAAWTGTSIGNAGGNSGITMTTPKNAYWVGTTASWNVANRWAATSGGATGAANFPLPQDTAIFDAASLSATATVTIGNAGVQRHPSIDTTNIDQALNLTMTQIFATQGNVTLASQATAQGAGGIQFENRSGTKTLDQNGGVITCPLKINAPGGTVELADNLNLSDSTNGLVLSLGTFDDGDFDVFIESTATDSGSGTKALVMGTGTWTFGNGVITIFSFVASGTTHTVNNTNIHITATNAAQQFVTGNKSYGNMVIDSGTAALTLSSSGQYSFANFTVTAPKAVILQAARTMLITGTIGNNGTAGNLVTLTSTSAGVAATISKASGTVSVDYWSIKDSAATGGATFNAGANSTNVSGNSGWNFASAVNSNAFFGFF